VAYSAIPSPPSVVILTLSYEATSYARVQVSITLTDIVSITYSWGTTLFTRVARTSNSYEPTSSNFVDWKVAWFAIASNAKKGKFVEVASVPDGIE